MPDSSSNLDGYRRVEMTPIDVELDLLDFRTFSREGINPLKRTAPKQPKKTGARLPRSAARCRTLDCAFFQPCPVHPASA